METKPKVSVIVPVHNSEKTLVQCLNSLFSSTILDDLEIIIIDNASTDDSRAIIQSYLDAYPIKSITYVPRETDGELSRSMIDGLLVARGEYVAQLDSDDWVEPNMYEELYNNSVKGMADVVLCNWRVFQAGEYAVHRRPITPSMRIRTFNMDRLTETEALFLLSDTPLLMPAIYKRDFLIRNDLFYRDKGIMEDTSLYPKILLCAREISLADKVLYTYRYNTETKKKVTGFYKGIFEQFAHLEDFLEKNHIELGKGVISYMKHLRYSWVYHNINNDKDRDIFYGMAIKEGVKVS